MHQTGLAGAQGQHLADAAGFERARHQKQIAVGVERLCQCIGIAAQKDQVIVVGGGLGQVALIPRLAAAEQQQHPVIGEGIEHLFQRRAPGAGRFDAAAGTFAR